MKKYRVIEVTKNGRDYTVTIDGVIRNVDKRMLRVHFSRIYEDVVSDRDFHGAKIFVEDIKEGDKK